MGKQMSEKTFHVVETVFDTLQKIHMALERNRKSTDYYEEGLNKSHIKTIMTLHIQKSGSMTEIGQRVGLVKGAFSPLVEHLIRLGYVDKNNAPNDRRKFILTLTPKGDEYAKRTALESAAAFEANFQRLNLEEQRAFLQHLNGLNEFLDLLISK
jgi:DNA-binding MarR family transcriptional regulator